MKYGKSKIIFALVVLLSLGFFLQEEDIYFKINRSIDIFGRVYREITLNYVDPIDPKNFMLAGIKGMLSSLDPYTVFIDENKQKDIDIITNGKYGGIGATVGLQNGKVVIVDLLEGYPAQRQGLRVGDVILKVDSVEMNKENYPELGKYLKKEPGSLIKLTIQREGEKEPLVFNVVTENIQLKNLTFYSFTKEDSSIVYLKLSGFTRQAGEEVKKALTELKREREIKGIILDLRGNPGGLLDAAIDVAEKFLPKGKVIVTIKGRDVESQRKYVSKENPVAGNARLAVLINGNTASASEIVTGAIQDYDRGVVVGTRSFGKGLVQTIIPLSFNTSLKMTTARYYTPSGRCIQKIDYSKNRKIFPEVKDDSTKVFRTAHNRTVYSRGGITPDTVVENRSHSEIIRDPLAKGYFFKFATHYFNKHPKMKLEALSEREIFNSFEKYLEQTDFKYKSLPEKKLEELEQVVLAEKPFRSVEKELVNLKNKFLGIKNNILEMNFEEVVNKIKEELATRISGRRGRIVESLRHDHQYKTAIKILEDKNIYEKLLNLNSKFQKS